MAPPPPAGAAADPGRAGPGPSEPRSLEEQLTLEAPGGDTFTWRGTSERRVFGGMLVAHALAAASATVDEGRRPQSLHASFIGSTDGRLPIRYDVERTRDGGSFTTRRVAARQQEGAAAFILTASFHAPEDGPEFEPPPPHGVPPPDGLGEGRYAGPWFDSRDVPVDDAFGEHTRLAWFRARKPLPDDPLLHVLALAYLSDHGPTRAVRQPHADHPAVEQRMSVSLDHSVWFHRPARVDTWLLSELRPLATGAGRGLALGSLRTADGTLVATVVQEALLRLPDAADD
jgi:acyl-CoA thioesterase II